MTIATLAVMVTPALVIQLVGWKPRSGSIKSQLTGWLYGGRMVRDSAATRARILDAATAEFAAHGLAGARVDRIAARAAANKQLIYAYFGNKEGLFDATVAAHLGRLLDAVPFEAGDLPGYAGRLYDALLAEPALLRLWQWHALERPGVLARMPDAVASTEAKLQALAAARDAGTVDATLPAPVLLELRAGGRARRDGRRRRGLARR